MLTPEYVTALCARTFSERHNQRIEEFRPLPSRQHEMVQFDLLWDTTRGIRRLPLVARHYVSTLSWWRAEDRGKAQREVSVTRWLRKQGFPVPEVLAREFDAHHDVVLYTRLPGQDWSAEGHPFAEVIGPYVERLAWLLHRLHRLRPPEDVRLVVPTVTLPVAMANLAALADLIGEPDLSTSIERIMGPACLAEEHPPVLLHGDYHFSNALIEDGQQISGIIDWEFSALGDPRWDVANAYMQLVDLDAAGPAAEFLNAYLHFSRLKFDAPPIYSAVASLQQWAVSEWLMRKQAAGRSPGFRLAADLTALRDTHRRRAEMALGWLQ